MIEKRRTVSTGTEAPRQVPQFTLASVIEQVYRSGSKPTTNSGTIAAVREQFARLFGDSPFPWNTVLVLKTWKEYENSADRRPMGIGAGGEQTHV